MSTIDLGIEDASVNGLVHSVCDAIATSGLAAVLRAVSTAGDGDQSLAPYRRDRGGSATGSDAAGLLSGASCNVIPGGMQEGVCHRLLIALSKGRGGRHGSCCILDEVVRHLAACGVSVDGIHPRCEPTQIAVIFHDELHTKVWRERHRPLLAAFQSRGVRVVLLHVDSTNCITWVERDLADVAGGAR